MNKETTLKITNQKGSSFILILVSSMFFLILVISAIELAQSQLRLNKQKTAQSQALQIAEAGINYYRWVLYHEEEHYFTTAGCAYDSSCDLGITDYDDPLNSTALEGKYHLTVQTPKKNGSSVVTLTSTGWTDNYPNLTKTIKVQLGKKSWSSYSILSNNNLFIESGNSIYGNVHSNGGIRMDGIAYGSVSSALKKYDDPSHCGVEEYGVHTHHNEQSGHCDCPTSPNNCNRDERYDDTRFLAGTMPNLYTNIFQAGRSFPVPPISFSILSSNISDMISKAEDTDGIVIDETTMNCAANNCDAGFHIELNANNYSVYNVSGTSCNGYAPASETLQTTNAYPDNGLILVRDRDKLWIDGTIDTNRVTILAFNGAIDEGDADIIINGNIRYQNSDGSESIGLIAQRDIVANECISSDLQIDAAIITKKGSLDLSNINSLENNLEINGSIAVYDTFLFKRTEKTCPDSGWNCQYDYYTNTCGWWDHCWQYTDYGYPNAVIHYDTNLTYNPPPHFPTTGDYTFLSWKEE